MYIVPVASGKGGVGKSLVSANLAIALAQAGKRVILADLDLGGSNLHLILGMNSINGSIGTLLNNSREKISSILNDTGIPNLQFIPGDSEIPGLANLTASQKRMLVRKLTSLEADYLIMDLGAGTGQTTLDFFLTSSHGIICTTPTPTATVSAYLFLKNAVFRVLQGTVGKTGAGADYIKELFQDKNNLRQVYFPDIARELDQRDPEAGQNFRHAMRRFNPRLIMNMLENPKDAEKINRLRRSAQQYLDLDLLHLGVIFRDDLQDTALSARLPIIRYKPSSILSQAVYRIADKMVQLEADTDGSVLDLETINDSFEAAETEAESDFENRMNYIEELLNTGALSTGDLVETIKSQHHELVQLKKQVNLYRSKVVRAINQGFTV
ncbi:ATP-binding protein [Alkalispirochaeta sphaeroplastigenens]|uniref:ATP-binding protein n=1 Tax=Alkalispirochaeta sphaeroplastigenens TaxID=1187066 RepID=A0A2S4JR89_9SPIO|nr:P-loop NTPase [Alkalispirochaeta sphaeroplastigenens]POR02048.1 ATP-binding protein [Alkalispirochaeta sphaeroplastigenens]